MKFSKMHGCGNDYIFINNFIEPWQLNATIIKHLCNRHFGIGSDGIISISPSQQADFRMQIFNTDASEAEMCGNGLRCAVKLAYETGIIQHTQNIKVETLGGIKTADIYLEDQKVTMVRINMGQATFFPNPLEKYPLICVNIGNPHAIMLVQDKVLNFPVDELGPFLEKHPVFPEHINVDFAEILDYNNVQLRIWERGNGETLACGTGASATVVALASKNFIGNQVTVHLIGGDLFIEITPSGIFMTGPATYVYSGEIDL